MQTDPWRWIKSLYRRLLGSGTMAYLARKVTRDKWHPSLDDLPAEEVPARLLHETTDLRATKNELSFWVSSVSGEDAILRAALAFVSDARSAIESSHFAWIARDDLERVGITLTPTEGRTPIADLKESHVDAVALDASRLSRLATLLGAAIRTVEPARCQTMTRVQLLNLVREAIAAGRVGRDNLNRSLRDQL